MIKIYSCVTTFEKDKNLYMCFRVNDTDTKDLEKSKIIRYNLTSNGLYSVKLDEGVSIKDFFKKCPKKVYYNTDIYRILSFGFFRDKKLELEKQNKKLDKKIKNLENNLIYFKTKYPELSI